MPSTRRPRQDASVDLFKQHRAKIRRLYQDKSKTLPEVKQIMESQHGFPNIPLSTYETRLRDELRLRKNLKRDEWHAVYQHWKRREGKDTGIYINGTRKPWKSAWKEMRRSGARSGDQGQCIPLPADVSVRTPSPISFPIPVTHSDQPSDPLLGGYPTPSILPIREMPVQTFQNVVEESRQSVVPIFENQGGPLSSTHICRDTPWELELANHENNSSSMVLASHVAKFTAFLVPALVKWSFSLQEIPWNRFKSELFTIATNESWAPRASNTALNRIARGLRDDLPATWEISYPSIFYSFFDPKPSPTALAFNFDVLNFLTRVIHLVSNNLIDWHILDDQIPDVLKVLLDHLPYTGLFELLQVDIPTMRATWEILTRCAGRYALRDAFRFLMEVGLRNHSWVLSNGHTYLSFAASMNDNTLVRNLLKLGIRPDDSFRTCTAESPYPAIVEAVAADSVECLKTLVAHCDMNQVIMYDQTIRPGASSFGVFLHTIANGRTDRFGESFKVKNSSRNLTLNLLLESGGVNVDLIYVHNCFSDRWCAHFCFDSQLSDFYKHEGIALELRPMLFEQSYFWDPNLFTILAKYSAKATAYITRPGICISAKQGSCVIQHYIESRIARDGLNTTKFLELILAEQFFVRGFDIDLEVVRGLIDFGVNPNLPSLNLDIHTLLYRVIVQAQLYGVSNNFTAVLTQLIQYGAVIGLKSLKAAVGKAGVYLLEILAQKGADIKSNGLKALCRAAYLDNYKAVSWLLEAGVDINGEIQTKNRGRLSIIMSSNLPHTVESIKPHGGDRELHSASCEMNRFFIQHGARLTHNPRDTNSFNFLYHFLGFHHIDELNKMKLFFNTGLTCEDLSDSDRFLLEACLSPDLFEERNGERLAVFEFLVRCGAPMKSSQVLPSLIRYGGSRNSIMELLEADIDINAYSKGTPENKPENKRWHKQTAVQAAAGRGDMQLVSFLMSKGADINSPAVGFDGRTALQHACSWDPLTADEKASKMNLVQFLIEHGADVNASAADDEGETALLIAAVRGDMETAALLLHHGAYPNVSGQHRSALDYAALFGRIDMVQFLMSVGALSQDQGTTGYDSAIREAESIGYFAIADLIRQNVKNDAILFGGNPVLTF